MAGNVTARELSNSLLVQRNRFESAILTLGGDYTIDGDMPQLLFIDPTAARTVTLPAEADSKGLFFIIVNTAGAAEAITIENDATDTVGSVTQNEAAFCVCDGTTWRVYGWVA